MKVHTLAALTLAAFLCICTYGTVSAVVHLIIHALTNGAPQ